MRIAILSDIHGNREAFDAVLEAVRRLAPDRIVLLGDLVGYGPDPVAVVEEAARLVEDGALCLLGNHDEAALRGPRGMTENARVAIEWTRRQLAPAHLAFLARLPLTLPEGDTLFVHASAETPGQWPYFLDAESAARCLASTEAATIVCGHTHVPALHYARPGRLPVRFSPLDNVEAPLSAAYRHVVTVGAVGQPRDGNPAACFALLDTRRRGVTMLRVPYDHEATAIKIAGYGLPAWLGLRLRIGR